MAGRDEDSFERDSDYEQLAEEYDRRESALHDLVERFIEEEELDDEYAVHLLLSLALKMRMSDYVLGVEKPSVTGLRIHVERMQQELGQMVRHAKKDAAEYLELAKAAREELVRENDEVDEREPDEKRSFRERDKGR